MTVKKSVLIVGAGIGGVATAVYLAKNGYKVDIYEKNSSPGGRCGQLLRDGHRFDLGATMLMMPGVYREIFDSLEIPLFENSDIRPFDDLYKVYFDNDEVITFTTDEEKMKDQLERIEPGSFARSQKYVADGYEILQIGMGKLIDRNFYNIFQFANFRNLIRHYYSMADKYRLKTYEIIEQISPKLEPRYQLSLEIIFNLYLMVFERIDLKKGTFTGGTQSYTRGNKRESL